MKKKSMMPVMKHCLYLRPNKAKEKKTQSKYNI